MSPLFGSDDETAVRWNLPRLLELGLLQDGEIMCEVEGALHDVHPGVLVVTDLAIHFVGRTVFGSTSNVVSIALEDVERVEALETKRLRRTVGALAVWRCWTMSDPTTQSERLGKFAALLDDDELLIHMAKDAWLGSRSGRVVVTDRRVAFFMGGLLWPHRCVMSVPLEGVLSVGLVDQRSGSVKLRLATDEEFGPEYRLEFDVADRATAEQLAAAIKDPADLVPAANMPFQEPLVCVQFELTESGRERAEQVAATIERQRRYLASRDVPARSEFDQAAGLEEVAGDPLPRVSLGRGVTEWVNEHGGRVYVWGDDFGGGFERMKASLDRPDGVEFVRTAAVGDFELYIEEGMSWTRSIRLTRRWFGFRSGIAVDTGLVVAGGI